MWALIVCLLILWSTQKITLVLSTLELKKINRLNQLLNLMEVAMIGLSVFYVTMIEHIVILSNMYKQINVEIK